MLQFCIFYVLILIITTTNVYYNLLFYFIELIFIGFFICLYQFELFCGFLWVLECTSVFITIVLLFYLNIVGISVYYLNKVNLYLVIIVVAFLSFFDFNIYSEFFINEHLTNINNFDDYYELFNNNLMHDFIILGINYYCISGLEFFFVTLLLLLCTFLYINLFNIMQNCKLIPQLDLLVNFDIFKDCLSFNFFRKQNLNTQNFVKEFLNFIKKV